MAADSIPEPLPEVAPTKGPSEVPRAVQSLYLACPYWLRTDDLAQAVKYLAADDLKLNVSVIHAESDICFGNKWEEKTKHIEAAKLVIARPDLKPSPVLDKRDLDVFVEVGYAIARGIPCTWLLHPKDEPLPFMVQSQEAVITSNVIDAVVGLKGHMDRAQRRPPFDIESSEGVFFSAPYSDEAVNRFQVGILPPLKAAGQMPFFAKRALGPGDAPTQALDQIRRSKCLVADVSSRSQNVAFEIGFALGLGIKVLLIRHRDAPYLEGNLGGFSSMEFESLGDLRAKIERLASTI